MAGDQVAAASAGPADPKPKDNALREVKILMLHGKTMLYDCHLKTLL